MGLSHSMPTPTSSLYTNVLGLSTVTDFSARRYFPTSLDPENSESDFIEDIESYIAFDRDTHKILYGKNITRKLPIASLTKIVSSVVALEHIPLDLDLHVSSHAASVGEATMGLTAGEVVSVQDALYGMMLPSGNDASEIISEGVGKHVLGTPQQEVDGGGARLWFVRQMNEKMQALGLYDSYFYNPTGLDEDSITTSNFSTALDMAIFTNYALSNNTFSDIVNTEEYIIPYEEGRHKAFYLYNILQFDRSYPGIKGVKPGISEYAKETLVSYVEHDGRRIIVVLLGSSHTKDDAIALYNKIYGTNVGVY